MRIRQVRQEFWTDDIVASLPDQIRLFYVGLWCVADDSGWFRADAASIGALLYPYRGKRRREINVRDWTERLVAVGRVVIHACGCGEIPTLGKHQVIGGKKSQSQLDKHRREHRVKIVPENPDNPVVGNGRVGNGTVDARASAQEKYDADVLAGWRRQRLPVDIVQ